MIRPRNHRLGFGVAVMRLRCMALCVIALMNGCSSEKPAEVEATLKVVNGSQKKSSTRNPDESIVLTAMDPLAVGLDFNHFSGFSDDHHFPSANGSGVAVFDFDNDTWPDLLFATGCQIPIPETSDQSTRLYRNIRGQWRVSDVSKSAGIGFDGFGAGLAAADFNNDGFGDFYISCFGENRLYVNQGDGSFILNESPSSASSSTFAASCGWGDLDNNGSVDLYVCNYGLWNINHRKACADREGRRAFCDPKEIDSSKDSVYKNLEDGSFESKTESTVVGQRRYRGQGLVIAHLNDDEFIDIYVGNDMHPNCLFMNQGNWEFTEDAQSTGSAFDGHGVSQASMGVSVSDVDRDGNTDLICTNYQNEHNTLYRNLSSGVWMDDSTGFGVFREGVPYIGWGVVFSDLNVDGWEDLLIVNGHVDKQPYGSPEVKYEQPSLAYRNDGGRFTFLPQCVRNAELAMGSCRGLATGDFDGDGDDDFVVTRQDKAPGLLRNDSKRLLSSKNVVFCGNRANRDAIGLLIELPSNKGVTGVVGGGSYLSCSDKCRVMAEVDSTAGIRIRWPGGKEWESMSLATGHGLYAVVEQAGESGSPASRSFVLPR